MTRRSRTILLSLALAAGLVLCWWLMRSDQTAAHPAALGSIGGPTAAAAVADPEATAQKLDAVAPIVPSSFSDPDRDTPVEVLTSGRRLIVQDLVTRTPVPDALVFVFDKAELADETRDWQQLIHRFQEFREFEAWFTSRARRFRTDAQGMTIVPFMDEDGSPTVVAMTPTCIGIGRYAGMEHEPIVVHTGPDRAVDVLVVHEDGTPAPGIAVTMMEGWDINRIPPWITDANGRVRVSTLLGARDWGKRVFHLPGLPGSSRVPFDAGTAETEVRLVAPATARLRVRVHGLDALPASSQSLLRVLVRVDVSVAGDSRPKHWFNAPLVNGIALTPRLPLGCRLLLRCHSPLDELEVVEVPVAGPTQRDEVLDLSIPLPPTRELFTVKLVDAAGAPLRNRRIYLPDVERRDSIIINAASATDADGILRGTLVGWRAPEDGAEPQHDTEDRDERCATVAAAHGPDPQGLVGKFRQPNPLKRGVNDLGTVSLFTRAVLVGGVVLDERRIPVARALVNGVLSWRNDDREETRSSWSAVSDADGRFTMRGNAQGDRMRLTCSRDMFFPSQQIDVPVGTDDAEVFLTRGGALEGRVVLPAGLSTYSLRVRVISGSADKELLKDYQRRANRWRYEPPWLSWSEVPLLTELSSDGRFCTETLPPGPATVLVVDADAPIAPFARVEGVDIQPGSVTHDPRLDPVDVSREFSVLSITARDENGEGLYDARVITEDDTTNVGRDCGLEYAAVFLVPSLPQDLVVVRKNYRDLVLRGVDGAREVQLRPGIEVELPIGPIPAGFTIPDEFESKVIWEAHAEDTSRRGSHFITEQNRATLTQSMFFPHPGRWRVTATIHASWGGFEGPVPIPLLNDGVITVPDGDGPYQIPLTAAPGFLEKHLRRN